MSRRARVGLAAAMIAAVPGGAMLASSVSANEVSGAVESAAVRIADAQTLEPASGQTAAFFPVFLDAPLEEAVDVYFYTVDGSATGGGANSGADYRTWGTPASPRRVTIPAGEVQRTINVPVLADGVAESDETFSVKIHSVVGAMAAPVDEATATIIDADNLESSVPVLNVSDAWAYTGEDGVRKAQFYVQLDRPATEELVVTLATADGTAIEGTDYNARGFAVKIPAGAMSRTFDVRVLNVPDLAAPVDFVLAGSVTSGPAVAELSLSGTGTILGT